MRVTNNMMMNRMLMNLNRNMRAMDKTMMQAATGKNFQLPSDDPVGVSKALKLKTDISQLAQFKKNTNDAISFMETSEIAIKSLEKALNRLRDLAEEAANGVLSNDETLKIKAEVEEIRKEIISLGNTTYAGKYIFSGKKVTSPLLNENGEYLVDLSNYKNPKAVDDRMQYGIGVNENIEINILGFQLFEMGQIPGSDVDTTAKWETGALTSNLQDGQEGTISFGGVTLTIRRDDTGTAGPVAGSTTANSATIVITNGTSQADFVNYVQQAFQGVASVPGSPINGFTFTTSGSPAGLEVTAPAEGSNYNQFQITLSEGLAKEKAYTLTSPGLDANGYVKTGAKAGLIALIETFQGYLDTADYSNLSKVIENFDGYLDRATTARSEIGAKVNRLDLVLERIADDNVNFTKLLSEVEDADIAEVYMNFLAQENVYRSSLAIGARVIQPSLLDYLR